MLNTRFPRAAQLIAGFALAVASLAAHALDMQPYDAKTFETAQKAGKAVALDFYAEWCPTCKAQEKALNQLKSDTGLDVLVLKVDYDNEKELRKTHKVKYQSTIVVFKGAQETTRILGDTDPDKIRTGLKTAL